MGLSNYVPGLAIALALITGASSPGWSQQIVCQPVKLTTCGAVGCSDTPAQGFSIRISADYSSVERCTPEGCSTYAAAAWQVADFVDVLFKVRSAFVRIEKSSSSFVQVGTVGLNVITIHGVCRPAS